ncbi:MAG: FtsW/RodA/SpoVE family cell cycle protein, partial [Patescibacteria group bacterium]
MTKFGGLWRQFDWVLAISTLLLVAIGLVVLYGITLSQDQPDWGNLNRQLIATGLGLLVAIVIALTDYQWLRTAARPSYIAGVALALAVLIFGATIRGTTGWFRLGLASFQPVELIKVVVIICLAWYLSRQPRPLNRLPVIATSGGGVLVFFILTILQPDLGSALVLFLIWLGLFLIIGLRSYQ